MKSQGYLKKIISCAFACLAGMVRLQAQTMRPYRFSLDSGDGPLFILLVLALFLFAIVLLLLVKVQQIRELLRKKTGRPDASFLKECTGSLSSRQIERVLQTKIPKNTVRILLVAWTSLSATDIPLNTFAQAAADATHKPLLSQTGILITIVLLLIPISLAIVLLTIKLKNVYTRFQNRQNLEKAGQLAAYLDHLPEQEAARLLSRRKQALDYQLSNRELSGDQPAEDKRGLLSINGEPGLPIVAVKQKAQQRPNIDPELGRLVLWYLGCATFWLLFGTTVGEYIGIKFVAPDADHISWLSFGRLRPVHTNSVFWGWASLGMLGLGYYIVPRVCNTKLANIKWAWYSLYLINASVIAGTICLLAGINNGGGEYREYIWPVMLLFAIGLVLTLINFMKTIARRTTKEIYISSWYIVSSIIFTIVIALVAYIPYWQNGLGETIAQGYYMHQGVGMWFMLFTLGIVYYFLPQQLNKPIYSYSLGILAFWTQILFYTLIGTHHFVFSAIPWWLQTVAIVGSAGMAIPVIAGTTNFLMTFKGTWYKVKGSYTLPFFLVGTVFYFTGSMQGTAEAFRETNLIWHFTDFTVAHSHLTMYGIICFFLWAAIYALIPRLTGKEAPQITIGVHFWLAFIGMLFYTIPLMYGSTLKGLLWKEGKPFIDGVVLMAPYWLWRAIGGSLMWLSHLFFAYNIYRMLSRSYIVDVKEAAIEKLEKDNNLSAQPIA
ncbi:cytochrome oxidase subunit I [Niabella ginsenosidivorans]|uniref:Cytochrome oxidase subunit I n=1 Tax=Niabella ginsenosidivorans TaxID=1176587 RepID=A0A1A9I5R0_9BACT|nr:cbb3-type cytochrome c oxidase subunit I [Niabella ginsenosidivorans]ANH82011.1 cytochrome oxidase subunit I [Niabella ginsenosidivorans]